MTKGNIIAIIFMAVLITAAIVVKVKYGDRIEIINETSETIFADIKAMKKKIQNTSGPATEKWLELENLCLDLIKKYPESREAPYAHIELARAYAEGRDDYDKAIKKLREVLYSYPDLSGSEGVYIQVIDLSRKKADRTNDWQDVIKVCEEYLRKYPDSPHAPGIAAYIGDIYRDRGDYDHARIAYGKVAEKYPSSRHAGEADFNVAVIELERGNKTRAIQILERLFSGNHPAAVTKAKAKLEEIRSEHVLDDIKEFYFQRYGTRTPFPLSSGVSSNPESVLERIREQKIDIIRYILDVNLMPEAGTIEYSGKVYLKNTGDEKKDILLQLSNGVGKLIITGNGQSLKHKREDGRIVIELPSPLINNEAIELGIEAMGAFRERDFIHIGNETGYAVPVSLWYPQTIAGDLFNCEISFKHDIGKRVFSVGEHSTTIANGNIALSSWKGKDVPGIWFVYGEFESTLHEGGQVSTYCFTKKGGSLNAGELTDIVGKIQDYYTGLFQLSPSVSLYVVETDIPDGFFFLDSAGLILFDGGQAFRGNKPVLFASAISRQYFGIYIPENNKKGYTTFLSDGMQSYFETTTTGLFTDDTGVKYSFSELRTLYYNLYQEFGDKSLEIITGNPEVFRAYARSKGAHILALLRNILGDTVFDNCIRRYLSNYGWKETTLSEFALACQDVTGSGLAGFLRPWVLESGLPEYHISVENIEETEQGYEVFIKIKQGNRPHAMPVGILFKSKDNVSKQVADIRYKTSADGKGYFEEDFKYVLTFEPTLVTLDPEDIILTSPGSVLIWEKSSNEKEEDTAPASDLMTEL